MKAHAIRVAAAQFHVGADVDKNLETCLRMIKQAAQGKADLVVLPEFCNHLSWYDDKQHCFDVSVSLHGDFLKAIAAKAAELAIHVVVNCTVQRDDGSATGSSLFYSASGELLADNTKQIYIGHENDFLTVAKTPGPIVDSPLGRLGFYACMDGVINETPRCLGLRGAQILFNSLNSFATDEASLHIPVRAGENKLFVVAANKIGPLVPEAMVEAISASTGIPVKFLSGAGESQIVAPDGGVLAKASLNQEEIVFANIDPADANQKCRPDGTDIFKNRRPELYTAISENPAGQTLPPMNGAETLHAALVQLTTLDLQTAAAAVADAVVAGAQWVALPPFFDGSGEPSELAQFSTKMIAALQAICGKAYVSTAAVLPCDDGYQYCAVLISADGLSLKQPQIHRSERHQWSVLADTVQTRELPFGRVALVCSDDSFYPETFRLLAMAGVEVAAVPLAPLEAWELETGLLERSAENRVNLLVATQASALGNSFATALQTDFTVMTEWKERAFDGLLSQPIWHRATAQTTCLAVTLFPANAANKVVSKNTDLLTNRPWQLSDAITAPIK